MLSSSMAESRHTDQLADEMYHLRLQCGRSQYPGTLFEACGVDAPKARPGY